MPIWNDFCCGNDGSNNKHYKCEKLNPVLTNDVLKQGSKQLEALQDSWNSFVNIRTNLFEKEIRNLFDLNLFSFQRNECGFMLCNNHFKYGNKDLFEATMSQLITMNNLYSTVDFSSAFDSSSPQTYSATSVTTHMLSNPAVFEERDAPEHKEQFNDNTIERITYFVLWNGIFCLFCKNNNFRGMQNSFDDVWYEHVTQLGDGKNIKKELFVKCKEYLTNTFGNVLLGFQLANKANGKDESKSQENLDNFDVGKLIFDGSNSKARMAQFDELIKYCIQDISSGKGFQQVNSGIGYYIINRLVFAVYKSLITDDGSFLSDLKNVFRKIMDFSIYNCCFAHLASKIVIDNGDNSVSEVFYVFEYFALKSMLSNEKCLMRFGYFENGTLLHSAVLCNMSYYGEMLLFDGFDFSSRNKKNDKSPYAIAKKRKQMLMLNKFDKYHKLSPVAVSMQPFLD